MNRRTFLFRSSGLALTAWLAPRAFADEPKTKMDRIALGTLLFRYRFKQTKPKEMPVIKDELTLLDVPQHHRDRFGIHKLEFWNEHFESLEPAYLTALREKIAAASCQLVNIQLDRISYDLASTDETVRVKSVSDVAQWIDIAAFLGSTCIRINPGRPQGTVEKSIESFKELAPYARSKKVIIITANHFGIEMNPDKHVQIVKGAGEGVYTEPDFGNYPHDDQLFAKLEKIVPQAYIVSAKMDEFDAKLEHISYDFDRCVQLCEKLGFRGTYMVAQWSPKFQDIDYSKVADWGIAHIKNNLSA